MGIMLMRNNSFPFFTGPVGFDGTMNLIIWHESAEHGPYDLETVERYMREGNLSPKMLARPETEAEWKPLETFLPKKKPVKKAAPVAMPASQKSNVSKRAFLILCAITLTAALSFTAFTLFQKHQAHSRLLARAALSRHALAEVVKIQSAVSAGLNREEFGKRVLDARVGLDAALQEASLLDASSQEYRPITEADIAVRKALQHYLKARDFWSYCAEFSYADWGAPDLAGLNKEKFSAFVEYAIEPVRGESNSLFVSRSGGLKTIWGAAASELRTANDILAQIK